MGPRPSGPLDPTDQSEIGENRTIKLRTFSDVVQREEALLSVVQFANPPILAVLAQHLNSLTSNQIQLVGSLGLVVVKNEHLSTKKQIVRDSQHEVKVK